MDFFHDVTILGLAPYLWLAIIAAAAISAPVEKRYVWYALSAAAAFVTSGFGIAFRWQTVIFLSVSALSISGSLNKTNKHNIKGHDKNEKSSDNNGQ